MIVSPVASALRMKRNRNDEVKLVSAPGLKKGGSQERAQQADQISSSAKFQLLDYFAELRRVIAKGPRSRIGRHLQDTVSAEVVRGIVKALHGQSAGRAARRSYFQGKNIIPAPAADPTILMPGQRSGTDEAFFRINEIQEAVEQPSA